MAMNRRFAASACCMCACMANLGHGPVF